MNQGGGERAVVAFAPGSVGNLSCGFDVLGLALERPGDRVTARVRPEPGVVLRSVTGDGGRLPREADRNGATVAARTLLERAGRSDGVVLDLEKGLPLSGGMGGSAASAAAAITAVDALLDLDSSPETLLECALEGERVVTGSAHADNVAPALFGGLLLVRRSAVRPVVRLPVPRELAVALVHPAVEVETRRARQLLGRSVDLEAAVDQWGNTAALVAALYTEDWDLMADALVDRVAEPLRATRIPRFQEVRARAREAGAVAVGISGSGPALFALCRGMETARRVGGAMREAFEEEDGPRATLHLSPAGERGARIVDGDGEGG